MVATNLYSNISHTDHDFNGIAMWPGVRNAKLTQIWVGDGNIQIDRQLIQQFMDIGSLQWRHNERDGVANHRHADYLLNRLFRRKSKKISKLCVTGLRRRPVNSSHKGPVTRKIFSFDDVIMNMRTIVGSVWVCGRGNNRVAYMF